ncbi:3-oxoacyl-ACP reductase FabG [Fimbriiglobus ruber]|uniref:3-oxoacyl-[acyl-carrier protein] reductase n=1 Tax=Fimbriiglobus ruber TaxID=1908690 RepID=A0A225DDB8_9BACT|nr:3-oxoacyl-ACP reductase FabG [Fimbriiglobus ruber]OWK37634.1 3-oxoacyl-[acyl-carrier protein] reductase [Fimbriiglobus ruber]
MIAIDLSGKTAVVTGAGQGLGRATATLLHRAGAAVVVNYFEEGQGANRARAEEAVAALGSRAVAVAADVRQPDQVAALLDEAVRQFGALHIVVNNAAVIRDRTLRKMTDAEWAAVIDTNLSGVFHVCRAAAERIADGGRIVNMASISGVVGFFGQANYSAAKAGVIGLTKAVGKELARRQVTVNAVAPGVVLTEMGQSIPEAARAEMLKQIPFGRLGEADEIANAILFLCSDLAAYITCQTIHVNGGWWG